jgi:hypothetical protein
MNPSGSEEFIRSSALQPVEPQAEASTKSAAPDVSDRALLLGDLDFQQTLQGGSCLQQPSAAQDSPITAVGRGRRQGLTASSIRCLARAAVPQMLVMEGQELAPPERILLGPCSTQCVKSSRDKPGIKVIVVGM